MPGAANSRFTFATYRTDAALIDAQRACASALPRSAPVPDESVVDPEPEAKQPVTSDAASDGLATNCDADTHACKPEVDTLNIPGRERLATR
eukprot:6213517-Pleurochrysis_carterae.AAC.1